MNGEDVIVFSKRRVSLPPSPTANSSCQGVPCVTVTVLPVPFWITFEVLPSYWKTAALLLVPSCSIVLMLPPFSCKTLAKVEKLKNIVSSFLDV